MAIHGGIYPAHSVVHTFVREDPNVRAYPGIERHQAGGEGIRREGVYRDCRELDEKEQFDDGPWKKAAELGFLGEEYGGAGMGRLEQCLIIERLARVHTGIAQSMVAAYFGTRLINLYGTEEQKQKYLRPIVKGEWRCGMASTEPDAGSDAAAITTAVKDGDDYVILKEYDVEHYRRDAKVLEIFEGTKEVEKMLIGKKILA
jgi:alkylation response protein AidB-like acyl-CoA dehydrogenase